MDSADQSMYDDSAAGPPADGAAAEQPDEGSSEGENYPTAVVSKDAFGAHDIKPGSTFSGKIVRVNEADVEVQITECGEPEQGGEQGGEAPPAPQSDMGAMME